MFNLCYLCSMVHLIFYSLLCYTSQNIYIYFKNNYCSNGIIFHSFLFHNNSSFSEIKALSICFLFPSPPPCTSNIQPFPFSSIAPFATLSSFSPSLFSPFLLIFPTNLLCPDFIPPIPYHAYVLLFHSNFLNYYFPFLLSPFPYFISANINT